MTDTYQMPNIYRICRKEPSGGSVEITAECTKAGRKSIPYRQTHLKDGKITFTPEEMAQINKSVTDKLGQAGNPLANKIKITEKK